MVWGSEPQQPDFGSSACCTLHKWMKAIQLWLCILMIGPFVVGQFYVLLLRCGLGSAWLWRRSRPYVQACFLQTSAVKMRNLQVPNLQPWSVRVRVRVVYILCSSWRLPCGRHVPKPGVPLLLRLIVMPVPEAPLLVTY